MGIKWDIASLFIYFKNAYVSVRWEVLYNIITELLSPFNS
jgi:hypothetical protein